MGNEFTDLEILRARAAQYGIGVWVDADGNYWIQTLDEQSLIKHEYPTESDALNAAIRLGEIARRLNEGRKG